MRLAFTFMILLAVVRATADEEVAPLSGVALQAKISSTALKYFIDHSHPKSGLVRDSAENFKPTPDENRRASIASTGFGLAVIANASQRGLVTRAFAKDYLLKVLRFSQAHVDRRKGWFLHYMDWETGARLDNSEYSTIDSALFFAGALYAAQLFPKTEIERIARQLYKEADFIDAMTDGGKRPTKKTLSMAYSPESGYTPYQWSSYDEEMLLLLLGLGHPTNPLPADAWKAWNRQSKILESSETLMGFAEPLFVHQYSQVFVDFRHFNDGFGNYFHNSVLATEFNRETCLKDKRYKTFREGFWGLSAGLSPSGYSVYSPTDFNGTICAGCVPGSLMLLPKVLLSDLAQWMAGPYKKQIFGRYGLVDSLNLDRKWFAQQVLGITVGTEYLAEADMRPETSVWKDFNRIPEIKVALKRAQSIKTKKQTVGLN
jgi:hypothetical protein